MTTPATYHQGVVIPKLKPHFGEPDEVVVTFVKLGPKEVKKKATVKKADPLAPLKQLNGLLPKNFPEGAIYIRKLRGEMEKEWEERFKRLGI